MTAASPVALKTDSARLASAIFAPAFLSAVVTAQMITKGRARPPPDSGSWLRGLCLFRAWTNRRFGVRRSILARW
jgi:hypothetical protein